MFQIMISPRTVFVNIDEMSKLEKYEKKNSVTIISQPS